MFCETVHPTKVNGFSLHLGQAGNKGVNGQYTSPRILVCLSLGQFKANKRGIGPLLETISIKIKSWPFDPKCFHAVGQCRGLDTEKFRCTFFSPDPPLSMA